ncbi:42602_t:CDS:2, partial [Gigaspora margarita]
MFINNNILPEDQVKRENLLITAIIPGPNCPKNFNSFMSPIIDELKKLEGIAGESAAMHMYKHWSRTFYSDKSLNNSETNPQTLSKPIWKNIGYIMEANKKSMPSEFGRSPLNIVQHSNAYKAEDWRLYGMLQPMVRFNQHPYKNLMNNILLQDRFYLHFVSTLYTQISPPQLSKHFQSRQVVWIKDGEEELWAPSLDYTSNNKEFIALSNFYFANLEEPILELNDWGVKYAKFHTREGYMIGSLMSTVAANARDNSCVL